jgi:kynurenine formamidase
MSKNVVDTEGPQTTSQYGALRAGLARLYARMRIHTPTHSGTHMHARKRMHAHTDQYVILTAFPQ